MESSLPPAFCAYAGVSRALPPAVYLGPRSISSRPPVLFCYYAEWLALVRRRPLATTPNFAPLSS